MTDPRSPVASPGARYLPHAIAAMCAVGTVGLYLVGLGAPFGNGDEAIYGEFVREMHRSGDYLTLRYQGIELLQRPPTAVTLYAAVGALVPGEFGIRLLPALLTVLTFVGIGAWLWRRTGRLEVAVAAMFVGAAIPSVHVYGRLAFSDPPFVLACTGALLATIAAQRDGRWIAWAGASLGGAFAVKSFAAGIPAVALGPWLLRAAWIHRRELAGRRATVYGTLWFLALAAPFYVVNFVRHGGRFYDEHFARILGARAAGDLESLIGIGGPSAYLRHIWLADGVGIAAVLVAGIVGIAAVAIRRRNAGLGVAATYAFVVFVGLTAVGTRLPHYLLVFYPGAIVCAGLALAALLGELPPSLRVVRVLAPVLALALLGTGLAREPFDGAVVPAPEAKVLGAAANVALAPDEAIYSLDWYAPALGYYAQRRWHMLVQPRALAASLAEVDPFRYTKNIHPAPPFPDGEIAVAGSLDTIRRAGLIVTTTIAEAGDVVLVRARRAPR